jgi:hypothetical protein
MEKRKKTVSTARPAPPPPVCGCKINWELELLKRTGAPHPTLFASNFWFLALRAASRL